MEKFKEKITSLQSEGKRLQEEVTAKESEMGKIMEEKAVLEEKLRSLEVREENADDNDDELLT